MISVNEAGRKGGSSTSKKKVKASRSNGKLGGRPKLYAVISDRLGNETVRCTFKQLQDSIDQMGYTDIFDLRVNGDQIVDDLTGEVIAVR